VLTDQIVPTWRPLFVVTLLAFGCNQGRQH
jgi:hypothetical protein